MCKILDSALYTLGLLFFYERRSDGKMKLFKSIDEKIAEIGFVKGVENEYGCSYTRWDSKYLYLQEVDIGKKRSGKHILQSYRLNLFDEDSPDNTCVGLTGYEMKLFIKKMKKMGLYSGKAVAKN